MCSPVAEILLVDAAPPALDDSAESSGEFASSIVVKRLKNSPARHRVAFQETIREISIESLTSLSESDKNVLWYKDDEIEAFKETARDLCSEIRLGLNTEERIVRGLELRLSQDRQRRKYLIIHAILRAQRRYQPKQLSNICRKCSAWSKVVATIEAQRDYCELYEPERLLTIPHYPSLETHPLPFKPKDASPPFLPVKRPVSPRPQHCVRARQAPCASC